MISIAEPASTMLLNVAALYKRLHYHTRQETISVSPYKARNYQCITMKGKKLSVYHHERQEAISVSPSKTRNYQCITRTSTLWLP